jgi:hypothetical protein
MKNQATKSHSKVWGIFILALCINILAAGAYSFIYFKIQQNSKHFAELSDEIDLLEAKKKNLKSVKNDIFETTALRDEIDNHFIPKDGVVNFLNSIQALGAKTNLKLEVGSVSVEPLSPVSEIFENVNVKMNFSGKWPNVYRFLAVTELMPFKVTVDEAGLDKVSGAVPDDKKIRVEDTWKGTLNIGVLKIK